MNYIVIYNVGKSRSVAKCDSYSSARSLAMVFCLKKGDICIVKTDPDTPNSGNLYQEDTFTFYNDGEKVIEFGHTIKFTKDGPEVYKYFTIL